MLANWKNLKQKYNAIGDGIADDTNALQSALNNTISSLIPLFIPAGVYKITQTLTMQYPAYIRILAEPGAVIKWVGATGSTMLQLNGIHYSRIGGLCFDGSGTAAIAIDQTWDGVHPEDFDTSNEYADLTFKDVGVGIDIAKNNLGGAEGVVNRCRFVNCGIGLRTNGLNALDWFIWYCTFLNCGIGLTNEAGNFHSFCSIYSGSTEADIKIHSASYLSLRYNYSINSKKFLLAPFIGYNGSVLTIQQNTIINPVDDDAISISNCGPVLLLDNVIKSRSTAQNSVVEYGFYDASAFQPTDLVSVGNKFTASNTIDMRAGKWISIDDVTVADSSINTTPPALQMAWAEIGRVLEVSPGATSQTIQSYIDLAAQYPSERFTIHLQAGTYNLDSSITIPTDLPLHILGDGIGTTNLVKNTPNNFGAVLVLQGPGNKVILEDFQIYSSTDNITGLVIQNSDQLGARVFMDQVFLQNALNNLIVDGLDHANVQLHNLFHQGQGVGRSDGAQGVSVSVVGGVGASNNKILSGRTSIFSGATSNNVLSYSVSNGGKLLVRDIWYEESAHLPAFAKLTGSGTFTHHNGKIATESGQSTPAIDVNNFNGKVSLLGGLLGDRIGISGDGSQTKVLALGQQQDTNNPNYLVDNSSPAAKAIKINSRVYSSVSSQAPDQNSLSANDTKAFILEMLQHTRNEKPDLLTPKPAGVTDVRLYRLLVNCRQTGIAILP